MMNTNFSPQLKQVLTQSTEEVKRHNGRTILPEHLLYALISGAGSKEMDLLGKISNTTHAERLRSQLDTFLLRKLWKTPALQKIPRQRYP